MGAKMTVPIPFFPVISKQLRILGSFRYGMGDYPLAISLVERGLIDLKPLVTHVVEFEEALEAFEHTRKGKDDSGKVSQPVGASSLKTKQLKGVQSEDEATEVEWC
jgi:D-xylulose reductase